MSSSFGQWLKLSIFGQSHGPAVGVTLDGFPAGMAIDTEALALELARRAPGQNAMTTTRRESDTPEFLSGVLGGRTTGQPLCAVIRSEHQRSGDYGDSVDLVRPGHADYTGHVRYFGFEDFRGGGSFSGRLTAPIVLAGALCAQWLRAQGVTIVSHALTVAEIRDEALPETCPDGETLRRLKAMPLPALRQEAADQMSEAILAAKAEGDSVGGTVELAAWGLPAGLGAPFFDSAESVLSHLFFSIPGVKAVAFGDGFGFAALRGSEANDPFRMEPETGRVVTATNHSGGINGGITNGMPLRATLAIRPTPSIAKPQQTVSLQRRENAELAIRGRHDPCILPRVCPVAEAMCAIGLIELWKERAACVK